ncbi:MAG: outer membrane beta-barrel protein [Acidobacteriota bacterium]
MRPLAPIPRAAAPGPAFAVSPAACLAACLAVCLATTLPARAQSYSDPGTGYGADAGWGGARDAESGGATGGVHARLRLTGGIGLELSAGYRSDTFAVDGARVLKVDQIPIEASFLLFFLHGGPVQPYVLGGAGYTWAKPKGEGPNADKSYPAENLFTLHAGAGVDLRTSFRTSLFLDGRYVFLVVDAIDTLRGQPKADYIRIAAGFNVYF